MILSGKILTMTERAEVEAVYLEGHQIGDVGSLEDLVARYPRAPKFSFEQITPGLHDAHTHPEMWGIQLAQLDLIGLNTPQQVADAVAKKVRQTPPGTWLRGAGFLLDHYPDKTLLDAVAPHNPVFLLSRDFHSSWVNSKALELAKIDSNTPDPEGGQIVKDAAGNPTGYLLERANGLVYSVLPAPSVADLERGLSDLAKRGYTATHHLGGSALTHAEQLAKENRLPVRLWWAMDKGNWRGVSPGWRGDSLEVAAVKFFMDGALGSRTAWMVEPYPDGSHGMALDSLEQIRSEGREALKAGYSLVTHAIGSRANHELISIYQEVAPLAKRPLRIEHVQHLRDQDLARLPGLPIAISMQPMHALEDAAMTRKNQPGLEHEAFRLRDLWNTGLPLAFSSDAPVSKPNLQDNLMAATHNPVLESQSLTLAETLWAHTRGAAIAAGWNQQGHIQAGSWADLTLWENGQPIGRVYKGEIELH